MDNVYKCYKCGKEFEEKDWELNENGELTYTCPDCGSVWYKEDCEESEIKEEDHE